MYASDRPDVVLATVIHDRVAVEKAILRSIRKRRAVNGREDGHAIVWLFQLSILYL